MQDLPPLLYWLVTSESQGFGLLCGISQFSAGRQKLSVLEDGDG
jgi:hypothetical protein